MTVADNNHHHITTSTQHYRTPSSSPPPPLSPSPPSIPVVGRGDPRAPQHGQLLLVQLRRRRRLRRRQTRTDLNYKLFFALLKVVLYLMTKNPTTKSCTILTQNILEASVAQN